MEDEQTQGTREIADRVIALAEELEVSGEVSVDTEELARDRAALHAWVDTVVGVVLTPGFGRVTVIHEIGRPSTISSWELCLKMTEPRNRRGTKSATPRP